MHRSLALAIAVSLVACSTGGDHDGADQADQAFTHEVCEPLSTVDWMQTERLNIAEYGVQARVGTMGTPTKGDVLFLEGFSDRIDNHPPLFQSFVDAGYRVIAFDYPSHGETCGRDLNLTSFEDLAGIAGSVERAKGDPQKPLYLAGWSTGGLLAVRLAQGILPGALSRPIAGMALLAPGVSVRPVLEDITVESLTHNPSPPHAGPPKPTSPLKKAVFSSALAFNSLVSNMPFGDVPTLVIMGGDDEDTYANTPGVRSWIDSRRADNAPIAAYACAGGRHELDNEAEPMGGAVRAAMQGFLEGGRDFTPSASGACTPY